MAQPIKVPSEERFSSKSQQTENLGNHRDRRMQIRKGIMSEENSGGQGNPGKFRWKEHGISITSAR